MLTFYLKVDVEKGQPNYQIGMKSGVPHSIKRKRNLSLFYYLKRARWSYISHISLKKLFINDRLWLTLLIYLIFFTITFFFPYIDIS